MDRRLIWTERASSDIEAIVRYIARRNPRAASEIGFGIYERAQTLLDHPKPERSSMSFAKVDGTS